MKNLSLRGAVSFGLTVFGLLIVSLSLQHWFALRQAHDAMVSLHNIAATKAIALEKTYAYVMRERLGAAIYSFGADESMPDQQKLMLQVLPTHLNNIEKQLALFESIPLPDAQGEKLARTLVEAFRGYVDNFVKPTFDAVQHNDMHAMKRMQLASTDGALSLNEALTQFNNYANKLTADRLVEAQSEFTHAGWLTAGSIVVAALMAALALVSIRRGVIAPLEMAASQFDAIARGNLATDVPPQGSAEIRRLFHALEKMRISLRDIVESVRRGTTEMNTGVDEIATGTSNLSSRTEEQAASLQQTAASMEQITATVKNSAANAQRASEMAARASEDAVQGGQAVSQVVTTMNGIADSAKRVVDIIGVIEGIAFQTNILALNAAVEAARAGEQGRGFAVVASEVRSLAQRSAAAAKDVKTLITDAVTHVDDGQSQVQKAGSTMTEIISSVKNVTQIMTEMSMATSEQTTGIEQVNQAVSQMDVVTQQNAALVEQSFAAAASLQEQAKHLATTVSVFQV